MTSCRNGLRPRYRWWRPLRRLAPTSRAPMRKRRRSPPPGRLQGSQPLFLLHRWVATSLAITLRRPPLRSHLVRVSLLRVANCRQLPQDPSCRADLVGSLRLHHPALAAGAPHHPPPPPQSARLAVAADRRQSQAVSSRPQTRRRQRRRHRLAPSRRRIRCSSSLSRSRMRPGRRCNRLRQAWLRPRWNRSIRPRRRTLVQPRQPKAVHRRLSPRRRPQPAVARPAWGWVRVEAGCRRRCR